MTIEPEKGNLFVLNQIAQLTIKMLFFCAIPLVFLSFLRVIQVGWLPVMWLHLFLLLTIGLLNFFKKKLPYQVIGLGIIFTLFLVGLGAIFHNQNVVYGAVFFLISIMMTQLFFTVQYAFVMILIVTCLQILSVLLLGQNLTIQAGFQIVSSNVLFFFASYIIYTMNRSLVELVETLQTQNQKLEIAEKQAQAANRAKSNFLAMMSHELRTPMNGLLNASVLLKTDALNVEQTKYVSIIQKSGRSLLTQLNDILDFSKIEAGKLSIEKIPVHVKSVFNDLYDLLIATAEEKGLDLILTLDPDIPEYLLGDPMRIRQILLNLIQNAIKFTDEGSVEINAKLKKCEDKTAQLLVSVKDTGIGISLDKQAHLFTAFQQLDPAISRKYGGTGLGLVIVKQLLESMGGKLNLDSQENKGSDFWFELALPVLEPIKEPETSEHDHSSELSPIENAQQFRILIADDNDINQMILTALLNEMGFKAIDCAEHGLSVLGQLKDQTYDLIFMDIHMPELDGLETTRRIRANVSQINAQVPIVALTASAMDSDKKECLEVGCNDFMSKPVDPIILRKKLLRWLGQEKWR